MDNNSCLVSMKSFSSSAILFILAGAAAVSLIVFVATRPTPPSSLDGFAQCLTQKGAKMYGAWWCPHCQAQKERFGNAFRFIAYTECSPNGTKTMSQECIDAGIKSYPSWIFADGKMESGEMELVDLAEKTGCSVTSTTNE